MNQQDRLMTNEPSKLTSLPQKYIAIEGAIGVGKTTLCKKLAHQFNLDLVLEQAQDNPFLEKFYADEANSALPTQLFFLFQRVQQINTLRQDDIFQPVRVADFIIEKDMLFAEATLEPHEFELYRKVYDHATAEIIDAPRPDIVIYLQASASTLLSRIKKRGIGIEKYINEDYLQHLNNAYASFFHTYSASPLLIVNADEIDWINNEKHFNALVEYIAGITSGRHYYNPSPKLLD